MLHIKPYSADSASVCCARQFAEFLQVTGGWFQIQKFKLTQVYMCICSVVDFLQGNLGQPAGGFPEPLTSRVVKDKPKIKVRLVRFLFRYKF